MAKASYLLELIIGAKSDPSLQRTLAGATYGINNIANFTGRMTSAIASGLETVGQKALDFATDAQETYKEFEQAMANTSAIANATAQQEASMEEAARYAGRTTTMTATQSAEALGYMALAGWSVNDSTKSLLPILRLAEATQADLQTTSDLVTDSMGALGLSVNDLDMYMDKLVATNNNANTTAEMLMESLIRTGGAANTLGVSLDDTITAVGVLASTGFKAEEAGTALNSIFTRIGANTEAAKGLKQIGVSIYDANGNFIGLRKSLIEIKDAMQGMSDSEKMNALRLIAGTRRVSQFQYLLDSVGTSINDTTDSWDTLENHVVNSTGALDVMNEKATDTMAAAQERLESAWNDLKIGFTETYSPYWKDMLDDLALKLPDITDKITEFGKTNSREIKAFIDGLGELAAGGANKLFDLISFTVKNKEVVLGVLTGTVAALTSINAVTRGIQVAANLALLGDTMRATIMNFGLLGIAIGGVVGAGVALQGLIRKNWQEQAVANLADHFGDLTFSIDELEDAAKRAVYGDTYGLFKAFDNQTEKINTTKDSIDQLSETLDKFDWMVDANIKLDTTEIQTYKDSISQLISDMKDYATDQQYKVNLSYTLLYGTSEGDVLDGINNFYSSYQDQLADLGTKLQQTVNDAFEDGLLTFDEKKKIADLRKQIADMQQELADAQYQTSIDTAQYDFAASKMDAESFETYVEKISGANDEKIKSYNEARDNLLNNLNLKYKGTENIPGVGEDYRRQRNEILSQWMNDTGASTAASLEQSLGGINSAYASETSKWGGSFNSLTSDFFKGANNPFTQYAEAVKVNAGAAQTTWISNLQQYIDSVEQAASEAAGGIGGQKAIQELLKTLEPQKETLEDLRDQYTKMGMEIPDSVAKGLSDISTLETLAGYTNSMWETVAYQISNSPDMQQAVLTASQTGATIPVALAEAIAKNAGMSDEAIKSYGDDTNRLIQAALGGDLTVDKNVNINIKPNAITTYMAKEQKQYIPGVGYLNLATGQVMKNAEGGIYNHEILTTAAEEGPEAIIPLNTTARAQSLWTEAGRRMGLLGGGRDKVLADRMDATATSTQTSYEVTFAPQFTFNGPADEKTVKEAVNMSYPEFKNMMDRYRREQQRVNFR